MMIMMMMMIDGRIDGWRWDGDGICETDDLGISWPHC